MPHALQTTDDVPPTVEETLVHVNDDVACLRGTCIDRLKFEVEFGLKRGTSDNSYLIKVIGTTMRQYSWAAGECLWSLMGEQADHDRG